MIEQIAKAMWDVRRAYANNSGIQLEFWGDGSVPRANGIMDEARAAIEAMREPTQAMKRSGALCMPDYDPSVDDAQTCWQSMIDAALARS